MGMVIRIGQVIRQACAITAIAFAAALLSCSRPKVVPLKIGLLPGESAPTVLRLNEPLRAFLEQELGRPVELVVGANYAATGEALRFGRIDVAYLGPVTYILQGHHAKLEPIARPSHANVGPTFQAVIIVPVDSPVRSLADLGGKSIAFGDPASTSGTWVPRHELLDAGLAAGRDYTKVVLGAHDAVARAVAGHKVDAGGLSMPIYRRLIGEKVIDPSTVRVLAESQPIPEYMWTVRQGLEPNLRERLRSALLSVKDPRALAVFRATAFVEARDGDVDIVRRWVEQVRAATPEEFSAL
jgi:phosphonate transport system substrate-binding protein